MKFQNGRQTIIELWTLKRQYLLMCHSPSFNRRCTNVSTHINVFFPLHIDMSRIQNVDCSWLRYKQYHAIVRCFKILLDNILRPRYCVPVKRTTEQIFTHYELIRKILVPDTFVKCSVCCYFCTNSAPKVAYIVVLDTVVHEPRSVKFEALKIW